MNEQTQHGPKLVVCIRNDDYPVSLEVRKIYREVEPKTPSPSPRAHLVGMKATGLAHRLYV